MNDREDIIGFRDGSPIRRHPDSTPGASVTPDEAPIGTIATIGHPANNVVIFKADDEQWHYLRTMFVVDREQFRGGWDIRTLAPITEGARA